MFLFKKKKDSGEAKVAVEVKKSAAPPVKVVDKTTKPAQKDKSEKGAPVRIVTPITAGSLQPPTNPDEIADSLLVKVAPNPEIENAVDDAVVAAVLNPKVDSTSPGPIETTTAATEGNSASAAQVSDSGKPPPSPISAAPAVATKSPSEADKKQAASEEKGNMFSNLFGKSEVDEESYLDRFIKNLPDVSIEEVVNEADEVKILISEWSQSQTK